MSRLAPGMHQQGSIVRWDSTRGFGFIRSASTQAEVFFHVCDFRGAPEPALRMVVEYQEIHVGGKGPRAMAVRARETVPPVAGKNGRGRSRSDSSNGDRRSSSTSQPTRSHGRDSGSGSGHAHHTGHAGRTDSAGRSPRSAHHASSASAPAPRSGQRARTGRSARASSPFPPAAGTALLLLLLPVWLLMLGWGLWSDRLPPWSAGALVALNLLTFWTYTTDKQAAITGARRVSENQLHLLSLLGGWPGAWLAQQVLRHKTRKLSFRALYWFTAAAHLVALALWLWRSPRLLSFL